MTAAPALLAARSALVIAHPGQELSIYGWLELVRPQVHVLTSGAVAAAQPRIAASAKLLDTIGAKKGSIFGRLSESELYSRILQGDTAYFQGLADELAAAFTASKVEFVVSGAAEGAHVASDVLRVVVDAAVAEDSARLGRAIENYEFINSPDANACPAELRRRSLRLLLYEEAFERKLEAAAQYVELAAEVRAALIASCLDAYRIECFWPSTGLAASASRRWEQRAQSLVAAGEYPQAIRFREHIAPLVTKLQRTARQAA